MFTFCEYYSMQELCLAMLINTGLEVVQYFLEKWIAPEKRQVCLTVPMNQPLVVTILMMKEFICGKTNNY